HCEGCITRNVNVFMLAFNHKTAGLAAVTAVWKTAGVVGNYIFHFPELKLPTAAVVHWVHLNSFCFVMVCDFKIAYNYGARSSCNCGCIQSMVLMRVGQQNIICL